MKKDHQIIEISTFDKKTKERLKLLCILVDGEPVEVAGGIVVSTSSMKKEELASTGYASKAYDWQTVSRKDERVESKKNLEGSILNGKDLREVV